MAITRTATLTDRELGAWRGILQVHAVITRELDAELLASHDLSLSSYEVLMTLATHPDGSLRMSELADAVLISRSGLTRLVDRLERSGLVRRRPCPDDARGQLAEVTAAGRRLFEKARATHLEGVRRRFIAHFGDDELDELGAFWTRVLGDSGR